MVFRIFKEKTKAFSNRLAAAGLLTVLNLVMPACTAHKQPSSVEIALANMAKDIVIPIEAENRKNPLPNNQETVDGGRRVYVQFCAVCHGSDGHGQTTLGRGMYPPAMDLTSPHVQHWDESALFWIIQNGVAMTGMPSWKSTIPADDTWKMVAFIRNLPQLDVAETKPSPQQPAAQSPAQLIAYGRTLYRQEGCFMCHRLNGQGGQVGPDLTVEGTRGRSREWLVGHFKDPMAYVRGSLMPSFKNLTEEQLNALTAFLESQKGDQNHK